MDVFWAAFGGGAAAGVVTLLAVAISELVRWKLAQPKLVVRMSVGFLTGDDNSPKVFFEARNPRIHPATVSTFGCLVRSGSEHKNLQVMPQSGFKFPYEIAGGHSLVQWTDSDEFSQALDQSHSKPPDIKHAWFNTAAGKEFRGKPSKETIESLVKLQGTNNNDRVIQGNS